MQPSVLLKLLLFAALSSPASALATAKGAPQIHVVSKGDCLEAIAKHYGVSVAALRKANGLSSKAVLKVRQRLTVPDAPRQEESEATPPSSAKAGAFTTASISSSAARHRVVPGETLSHIALRYGTTVEALSNANGITKSDSIRSGQLLAVPGPSQQSNAPWRRYAKRVAKPGHLNLWTSAARFNGAVVDRSGRLLPSAVRALNNLLNAGGAHPALPERLIRLLVKVSDDFGGRGIRVVSGYRRNSYYQDSRHKVSCAVDFIISGVPNEIVRDYLREFEDVGVGYYPNSSFVHLDVRDHSAYWVDYAGPGEPPRSSPNAPAHPRRAERKLFAELDELLQRANKAIHRTQGEAVAEARRGRTPKQPARREEAARTPANREPARSAAETDETLLMEPGSLAGATVSRPKALLPRLDDQLQSLNEQDRSNDARALPVAP